MSLSSKEKYKIFKPKKFLGQNFLTDENISRKIVASLDIKSSDKVIEIGPGYGALTKFLVNSKCDFIAIEIDRSIAGKLRDKYNGISIIEKDFLDVSLKDLAGNKKIKIVGNIPYNITSQILFKFFDDRDVIKMAVVMMQKEVAQRLVATKGTKNYGILSLNAQIYSDIKKLFTVPPTAFFPKPAVDSMVLSFSFLRKVDFIKNHSLFREFLRAAFSQRRKTLRNSLKSFFENYQTNVNSLSTDLSRRSESLAIDEIIDLYNEILSSSHIPNP